MEAAVVVLDNGSGFIKAGLHTDPEPTCVVPQLIGRPRNRRITSDAREIFVGQRAMTMSAVCAVTSTTDRGLIGSFDDQSLIFEDLFDKELSINPYNHPVLLTQLPLYIRSQEEHLTAELFERFCVPALVKKPDCILSLMDAGELTGVVIDCGDSVSHSSAIYEGGILLNTVKNCPPRNRILCHLQQRHASHFPHQGEPPSHRFCPTTIWLRRSSSVTYTLPDGEKIQIKAESLPELYLAGEILFEPDRMGVRSEGLSEMLLAAVANTPTSLRPEVMENVSHGGPVWRLLSVEWAAGADGNRGLREFRSEGSVDASSAAAIFDLAWRGTPFTAIDIFSNERDTRGVLRGGST